MASIWPLFILSLSLLQPFFSISTIDLFTNWCNQHSKTYTSGQEKQERLKVFQENLAFVTQHNNLGNSTYTLSLNAFSDLSHDEFKAQRLGLAVSDDVGFNGVEEFREIKVVVGDDVPVAVDWRKNGAVTNVKDQGSCGACWSFSATGAMEGVNKIYSGSLVTLSEQELVDCDKSYNNGCEGGLMDYAYKFVIDNHGIDTEEDYAYKMRETTCNKEKLKKHVVTIDGYTDIPPGNEKQLLKAVAAQPVSVGICGSERSFQLYSKGIFTGPCSTSLDHAVLIVGYGSENGVDYWIIKNSWGTRWGMNGYMHMLRNSGNSEGVCGINMLASYPTKSSSNPPPSPSPGPTKCSIFSSCPEGQTCCCSWYLLGVCMSWKCCELDSAVCCSDRIHCCPHDYPVCDTRRNQCLKHVGNVTIAKVLQQRGFVGRLVDRFFI